jgi:hypothetical protein
LEVQSVQNTVSAWAAWAAIMAMAAASSWVLFITASLPGKRFSEQGVMLFRPAGDRNSPFGLMVSGGPAPVEPQAAPGGSRGRSLLGPSTSVSPGTAAEPPESRRFSALLRPTLRHAAATIGNQANRPAGADSAATGGR